MESRVSKSSNGGCPKMKIGSPLGNLPPRFPLPSCVPLVIPIVSTRTSPAPKASSTMESVRKAQPFSSFRSFPMLMMTWPLSALVALAALIAFAKVQQANRGYRKRVETTDKKHLEKSANLFKLNTSPFRHIGHGTGGIGKRPPRNPFKNMK